MRFYRAFFFGVLLLSALQGKGVFHVNGFYDLDSDGKLEAMVFNSREMSVMLIEFISSVHSDTVWSYTAPEGIAIADVEVIDINKDGLSELILISSSLSFSKDKPWLYVFIGKKSGFSKEPVTYKDSLFELSTTRPTNMTTIPGETTKLGVCFSSPVRQGVIFNIELVNNKIKINNLDTLSSPVFNNGYGILQIGGFISDGKDLVSILSLEQGELKTAIFDVNQNYKLIHSKIIEVKESESILSLGVESYNTKRAEQNGLLLPFRSDNVYMLYLEGENIILSNTSLSNTKAYSRDNYDFSINALLKQRENTIILDKKPLLTDFSSSEIAQDRLPPPEISIDIRDLTLDKSSNEMVLNNIQQSTKNESESMLNPKQDYSTLSPTLGDFLNNVKKDLKAPPIHKTKITVPEVNSDMHSVNWADEAGFLQMNLGEFIPEKTDTTQIKDPIPSLNLEITKFPSEAKEALNQDTINLDTMAFISGIDQIDLYYVLAMTSASNTKDRYVFDGEAPFGVAVNQVPLTGEATHFQHGISANLASLKLGETFDFAYSLRDKKSELDSITTLTMIHDMQTDIVLMSISPSEDSISQSYQPESFDPKLYEFPNYFFDGFPNSLDMDFKDKLIRFSFNGVEDSVHQGLYLSSTTPSSPPQSLAVFVDEGILQAIRGEIVVRPNGSKKVTTEFDLIGSVKPSVMFSKLIQEKFSEELKEKLLQGASLEEPLFGPKGKLPKIIQEPRLPEVETSQPEQEIPVELNKNNVLESNLKNDSLLIKSSIDENKYNIFIPETQKDELIPSDLEDNILQKDSTVVNDSLNLEKGKFEKQVNESLSAPKSDKSHPERQNYK